MTFGDGFVQVVAGGVPVWHRLEKIYRSPSHPERVAWGFTGDPSTGLPFKAWLDQQERRAAGDGLDAEARFRRALDVPVDSVAVFRPPVDYIAVTK